MKPTMDCVFPRNTFQNLGQDNWPRPQTLHFVGLDNSQGPPVCLPRPCSDREGTTMLWALDVNASWDPVPTSPGSVWALAFSQCTVTRVNGHTSLGESLEESLTGLLMGKALPCGELASHWVSDSQTGPGLAKMSNVLCLFSRSDCSQPPDHPRLISLDYTHLVVLVLAALLRPWRCHFPLSMS